MVLRDTELAGQFRVAVQGVKGPSSLATVPNFDPVWGYTVDYMHCALLGVTRQVTETLIASSNSTMAFYIGMHHSHYFKCLSVAFHIFCNHCSMLKGFRTW